MKFSYSIVVAAVCIGLAYGYYIEQAEIQYDSEEDYRLEDSELDVEGRKQCKCYEEDGCLCTARQHGMRVNVFVSLDELERHGKERILAHFCVNGDHFVKKFPVNKLEMICHRVKGKRYCFEFKVQDDGKENTLPGCVKMVKPVHLNLGCFELPL